MESPWQVHIFTHVAAGSGGDDHGVDCGDGSLMVVVVVFLVFICDNGLKGKASEPSSGSPDKNQLKMPIRPEHNT